MLCLAFVGSRSNREFKEIVAGGNLPFHALFHWVAVTVNSKRLWRHRARLHRSTEPGRSNREFKEIVAVGELIASDRLVVSRSNREFKEIVAERSRS